MEQHFLSAISNELGENLNDIIQARLNKATSILSLIDPYLCKLSNPRVIGIGSSFCTLEHRFSEKYNYSEITCLEPDKAAIEALPSSKLNKINDSALNIEKLDLGVFDLILCHQVLEHINQYRDVLPQMEKLMKPGAMCYINVPNPYAITSVSYPSATGFNKVKVLVIVKYWFICMSYKFRRDFMTNTEKYHTGFSGKIIKKNFPDFQIIDIRKDRFKQVFKSAFAKRIIDSLPSIVLDIISPTNAWIIIKK